MTALEARAVCTLCGAENYDPLLHLRIVHGVLSPEDYVRKIDEKQASASSKAEFRAYVAELTRLRDVGEISAEEWRKRANAWKPTK